MSAPSRFWFTVAGWVTCYLTGRGDRVAALFGQARLETGNYGSLAWRSGAGAWCMHYSPTGTPRANGRYNGAEPVALYTGWFRSWRMWRDRLDWDIRREIPAPNTLSEYQDNVLRKWLGNVDQERQDSYQVAWTGRYDVLPAPTRWMGGVGSPTALGRVGRVILAALVTSVVLVALWYAFKALRKAWRKWRGKKG